MTSLEAMKKELENYDRDIDMLMTIATNMNNNAKKVGDEMKAQIDMINGIVYDKMDPAIDEIDGATQAAEKINNSNHSKVQYVSWILTLIFLVLIFILQFAWKTH